ncbi:hypothetical protein [Ammoniphilus resinae]|uniref:Uncharacterized protein n=1 Tax=Ammoniphilus resinae TaxID=861532 RepID=A0ABS4GMW9_9BACL|nr:hypothetical protein [Ammoniphilus resinae]MBP1931623.1 hypothetical protein [Ammoniphilus resinae]
MTDQLIFFDALENEVNRSPHHLLLLRTELNELQFEAILLTSAAIYLFFVIPSDVRNLSITGKLLEAQREDKFLAWKRGAGEKQINAVQNELGLPSLPVFECYVLPSKWGPVRIVGHRSLVLSCDLFPSFIQQIGGRENETIRNKQQALYQHLKKTSELTAVSKEKGILELEGSRQQAAAIAIPETSNVGLPPRQAKRKEQTKENIFLLFWRVFFKKRQKKG